MLTTPSPTSTPAPKDHDPTPSVPSISNPITAEEKAEAVGKVTRPSISFAGAGASAKDGRRSSIQFAPSADLPVRASKARIPSLKPAGRNPSPPPASTYETRVSFDTFDNKDATDISFTLVSKHKNYTYTRRSRTFLCGTDQNDYSEFALEWLVEELVEDGDEIVCLRVVDKDSKIASDPSVQQGIYKEEARSLLDSVQRKNEGGKSISLVLELAVGKVPETIQRMIKIYAPACLIVGTRGRSLGGISGLLAGSVSKYCLQNSPVPVVVVRPEDKRNKKKAKRLANPTRQGYSSILSTASANPRNSLAFDTLAAQSSDVKASDGEAEAVARAIGLNEEAFGAWKGFDKSDVVGVPLSKMTTAASPRSDVGTEDSPSPTGPLVMDDEELEEVPEMEGLSSPIGSEPDEDGDKEDAGDNKDELSSTKTEDVTGGGRAPVDEIEALSLADEAGSVKQAGKEEHGGS